LVTKNGLNRWNQVVMVAKKDDLGLFGQCLKDMVKNNFPEFELEISRKILDNKRT
jgi:hypothetical protein